MEVLVRVLGSTSLVGGDSTVVLDSPRLRQLLAVLAHDANAVLPADLLAERLWDGHVPGSAAAALRVHVGKLRQALAAAGLADRLRTVRPGYLLMLGDGELDAEVFSALVSRATALVGTAPARALHELDHALSLWGEPYEDVADHEFVTPTVTRLRELHGTADLCRIEALLGMGNATQAAADVEAVIAHHPWRERLRELQMLALYRLGRQHEALAVFQDARRALADELGLEPGPGLVALQRRVLAHDPALQLGLAEPVTRVGALVFTDIEDSTGLVHRLATAYPVVIREFKAVLRDVCQKHGGEVVDSAGDGGFLAFPTVQQAAGFCTETQAELRGKRFVDGVELRVRMGIHVGEATIQDGHWSGVSVHTAARVADAANGGQVLLSSAAVAELAANAHVVSPRGEHWLKGFSAPVALHELSTGAEQPLPPPRARRVGVPLPMEPNELVGRQQDLDAVRTLMDRHRMVCLVGPGGVGKSRLCLRLARQWVDRGRPVAHVALSPLSDATAVNEAIAEALDLPADAGLAALAERAAGGNTLVVLDNCEHVLDAVRPMARDLFQAGFQLLLNSREALDVAEEVTYRVEALARPSSTDSLDELRGCPSVALFCQRAAAVNPQADPLAAPALLVELIGRLDSLPLALELAAGRMRSRSVEEILDGLDRRLTSLSRPGAPEHHQTLASTVRWSYDLLSPDEQLVTRAFGAFAGDVDITGIAAVCGLPDVDLVVESLVAKSLVTVRAAGAGEPTRFGMLETIRAVVRALPDPAESRALTDRHARWLTDVMARVGLDLSQHGPAIAAFDAYADELRQALERGEELDPALHAAVALGAFPYLAHRPVLAAPAWFDAVFTRDDAADGDRALAYAFGTWLRYHLDVSLDDAQSGVDPALELAERSDDPFVMATTLRCAGTSLLRTEPGRAEALAEKALVVALELDDAFNIPRCMNVIGGARFYRGDAEGSLQWYRGALEYDEAAGDDAHRPLALFNIGETLVALGRPAEAVPYLSASIQLQREHGSRMSVTGDGKLLAQALLDAGDAVAAAARAREFLHEARIAGAPRWRRELAEVLRAAAMSMGDDAAVAEAQADLAAARD